MTRIIKMSAWIFRFLDVVLKLWDLSETVFEITQKDLYHESSTSGIDDNNVNENADKFTLDKSPFFVVGTIVLLVQLTMLATGLQGLQPPGGEPGLVLGEVFYSVLMVLWFWPFVEGLLRKGKYGILLSNICKSAALTHDKN
ncbi:hypothetical protein Ddye_027921 [Dipteronia dyeriana]|uniref:Uncharacterized protein n=1 Tax=Dipteronia dyeriana TaxID=168575 RepID=A0AAD9WQZ0_9ROSI|nr:hypothetical protein Ddye_027921 [Dipteronia dyeriana]